METRHRALVATLTALIASNSWSVATPTDNLVPGQLLVRFQENSDGRAASLSMCYGATRARTLLLPRAELWLVPEGLEETLSDLLAAEPEILWAEPNFVYRAFATLPDDPGFSAQWGHARVHSADAWDVSTGSSDVIIAILDSGIDEGHPDLVDKIVAGYDFVDGDSDPHDLNGHGTHVAGIAAATTNNGVGIAGTSWGARLMPIRVLDGAGNGAIADITEGIVWAYQHGARIINLSLGGTVFSQAMQDAITAAWEDDVLVVAAMGNSRGDGNPVNYPAAMNHVLAVSATTNSDTYAFYSQFGGHCDLAAPGGEMSYYHDPAGIYSTMPTYPVYMTTQGLFFTNYDRVHGTSQAAPFVSGAAALILSIAPGLTPDAVQSLLEANALDLGPTGWDQDYGWGLLQIDTALHGATVICTDGCESGDTSSW